MLYDFVVKLVCIFNNLAVFVSISPSRPSNDENDIPVHVDKQAVG